MLPKFTGCWGSVRISECKALAARVACNWFGWKSKHAPGFREPRREYSGRVTWTRDTGTDLFAGAVSCFYLLWMVRNVNDSQRSHDAFWLAVLCQTVDLAVSGRGGIGLRDPLGLTSVTMQECSRCIGNELQIVGLVD